MKGWVRKLTISIFFDWNLPKNAKKNIHIFGQKIVYKKGWVGGKDKNQWKVHLNFL